MVEGLFEMQFACEIKKKKKKKKNDVRQETRVLSYSPLNAKNITKTRLFK